MCYISSMKLEFFHHKIRMNKGATINPTTFHFNHSQYKTACQVHHTSLPTDTWYWPIKKSFKLTVVLEKMLTCTFHRLYYWQWKLSKRSSIIAYIIMVFICVYSNYLHWHFFYLSLEYLILWYIFFSNYDMLNVVNISAMCSEIENSHWRFWPEL